MRTLMQCAQAALTYSPDDARIIADAAEEIARLRARVEVMEEALRPFAATFLFPDDFGERAAAAFRSRKDWDEQRSDDSTDNLEIRRGDIRAAREALRAALKETAP